MIRTLLTLAAGIGVGVAGTTAAHHDHHEAVKVTTARRSGTSSRSWTGRRQGDVPGGDASEPGQEDVPHRHAGPAFGYVLEGEYERAIDDQPAKVLKAGETFYEPTGSLHRVAKNPAAKGKTRVLAVILHPRDAKQVTIPEPKKK